MFGIVFTTNQRSVSFVTGDDVHIALRYGFILSVGSIYDLRVIVGPVDIILVFLLCGRGNGYDALLCLFRYLNWGNDSDFVRYMRLRCKSSLFLVDSRCILDLGALVILRHDIVRAGSFLPAMAACEGRLRGSDAGLVVASRVDSYAFV